MNAQEQKRIAHELTHNLEKTMLELIETGVVPEKWDGRQLRRWMADLAIERFVVEFSPRELREYTNARIVGNF